MNVPVVSEVPPLDYAALAAQHLPGLILPKRADESFGSFRCRVARTLWANGSRVRAWEVVLNRPILLPVRVEDGLFIPTFVEADWMVLEDAVSESRTSARSTACLLDICQRTERLFFPDRNLDCHLATPVRQPLGQFAVWLGLIVCLLFLLAALARLAGLS